MNMSWDEVATERMSEFNRLRSVVQAQEHIIGRRGDILFNVLEFIRKQVRDNFSDWKDADDWLFSNLDITKRELDEIYADSDELVHCESCIPDGEVQL